MRKLLLATGALTLLAGCTAQASNYYAGQAVGGQSINVVDVIKIVKILKKANALHLKPKV